jgi:REP element-mobilizing transposase RayT
LADSIPAALLAQVKDELHTVSPARIDVERRRKLEALLDMGHGSGVLRNRVAADCVIESWYHLDGHRYDLIAWVIMPTHVHVLIRPFEGQSLVRIVQSWKSYTGKRLKARYPHACVDGQFWKREYWDRYIRDEIHFFRAVEYIQQNPVKAGLVQNPSQWPYLGLPSGWLDHP